MIVNTEIKTMNELKTAHGLISLEAFGSMSALGNALKRLPGMLGGARGMFARQLDAPIVGFSPSRLNASAFKNKDYIDLRDMAVVVPEGLRSDYLTYVRALRQSGETAASMERNVLDPYIKWLGSMVGDPQRVASLSNNVKIPGMVDVDFARNEKQIQDLFVHQGQRTHEVPFGQAFARVADVQTLQQEVKELERLIGAKVQQRIVEKIDRATKLLSDVIDIVEDDSKGQRPSAASVKGLADTAYNVARILEQYGIFRYRLLELSNAVKKTDEILRKVR